MMRLTLHCDLWLKYNRQNTMKYDAPSSLTGPGFKPMIMNSSFYVPKVLALTTEPSPVQEWLFNWSSSVCHRTHQF